MHTLAQKEQARGGVEEIKEGGVESINRSLGGENCLFKEGRTRKSDAEEKFTKPFWEKKTWELVICRLQGKGKLKPPQE